LRSALDRFPAPAPSLVKSWHCGNRWHARRQRPRIFFIPAVFYVVERLALGKPAAPLSLNRFPREAMTEMRKLFASLLAALLAGRFAPSARITKRPAAPIPGAYRGDEAAKAEAASLGDPKWWDVFRDEQLQSLIRTALQHNYDVRIAAARILDAQPNSASRAPINFLPVDGGAGLSSQRTAKSPVFPPLQQSYGQFSLSGAWQLDFWGKISPRHGSRPRLASRQRMGPPRKWSALLSRRSLRLISSFARWTFSSKFRENALTARRESLRLTTALSDRGNTSQLDVRQAEQLVYTASERIYVTKFMNNPQHVRVLANEMLATNLGLRLGLPMPASK